jgi:hypothetical protein
LNSAPLLLHLSYYNGISGVGLASVDTRYEPKTMTACTDQVIGDILSSWRYDISGITPSMRVDYEQHLEQCPHCSARQRLHRTVDVVLIGLSTISIAAFILALAIIHHVEPLQHWALVSLHLWEIPIVLSLQAAAVLGLLVSLMSWLLVAVATPAPVFLTDIAIREARLLQQRIPAELRGNDSRVA